MLNERRKKVLQSIINEFIESAAPVGSKALISKYDIPYSSATVRNEMMQLEEMGLLEKTHTSSGRIPSEAGYKFYTDYLLEMQKYAQMSLVALDEKDEYMELLEQLVQICHDTKVSFDERVREMIRLISLMTDYTVFYIGPSLERTNLSRLRLVQLSDNEALVLLITDVGKIETKIMSVNSLQDFDTLDNIIKYMDEVLSGISLSDLNANSEKIIKPMLMKHIPNYDYYYDELTEFFKSFVGSGIYFSGQANIITDESLDDFQKIKDIFAFFEDERAMQWFKGDVPGLRVHIGEDIRNEIFENHAVVHLTFNMPTQGHGTIGVLGPKRMQYNEVIQLLTFISQFIERGGV